MFIATREDVVSHPRVLVVAEAGSHTTVIESYASLFDGCYFTNALTEIALMEDAQVDHFKLQEESTKAFHIATLQVHQDRDSRFASHSISFGGQLARNDINVVLDAEGARVHAQRPVHGGRAPTRGLPHPRRSRQSQRQQRGSLQRDPRRPRPRRLQRPRKSAPGRAQKTDAQQSNKNLLLSRDAEIDTKPELEIYADDVKCAHGATVGQLDEHTLFYLRSRGIGEDQARGLLTYGFAREILERVDLAPLRDKLTEELLHRMPNAEQIREMVE